MYCRYCGKEMVEGAAVCVQCGAPKGAGNAYCAFCGNATAPGAVVCLSCGRQVNAVVLAPGQAQKSKLTAGLLGLFLGGFGVHNFYLGYTGRAVAQLVIQIVAVILTVCTAGILTPLMMITPIWSLVESIMIFAGSINKDGKGIPLKD